MRFAFIVHPLTPFQRRLLGVRTLQPSVFAGRPPRRHPASTIAKVKLEGLHGSSVEGVLVSVTGLPGELLGDQSAGMAAIGHALQVCEDWGAQVVGLGAVAAIIGGQGKAAQRQTQLPVMTGNASTAWAAVETVRKVQSVLGEHRPLTLFGPPGAVASAVLVRLVHTGEHVRVYHPAPPQPLRRKIAALNESGYGKAELVKSLRTTSAGGRVLVTASSTGGRVRLSELEAGTIVIDVAEPLDVVYDCEPRFDVCVLDGEFVRLPSTLQGGLWRTIYGLVTGQRRHIFACFAEPMMLALAQRLDLSHTGRTVPNDNLSEIARIAAEQGFWVDHLHERGLPVTDDRIFRVVES